MLLIVLIFVLGMSIYFILYSSNKKQRNTLAKQLLNTSPNYYEIIHLSILIWSRQKTKCTKIFCIFQKTLHCSCTCHKTHEKLSIYNLVSFQCMDLIQKLLFWSKSSINFYTKVLYLLNKILLLKNSQLVCFYLTTTILHKV